MAPPVEAQYINDALVARLASKLDEAGIVNVL